MSDELKLDATERLLFSALLLAGAEELPKGDPERREMLLAAKRLLDAPAPPKGTLPTEEIYSVAPADMALLRRHLAAFAPLKPIGEQNGNQSQKSATPPESENEAK